jgi:hypothetical protein
MDAHVFVRVPYGKTTTPLLQREFVMQGTRRPVGCIQEIYDFMKNAGPITKWMIFKDGTEEYMLNPSTMDIMLKGQVVATIK